MPTRQPIPSNWADYEGGGRRDSSESLTSHVHFPPDDNHPDRDHEYSSRHGSFSQAVRRRRSSMSMRISSIRYAGGVNSIDNFAASWTRAAGFHEIAPRVRPSFRFADESGTPTPEGHDVEHGSTPSHDHRSLLRAALVHESRRSSDNAIDEEDHNAVKNSWVPATEGSTMRDRSSTMRSDRPFFHVEPQLASVFGGSYGTSYGSFGGMPRDTIGRNRITRAQPTIAASPVEEDEQQPLLVKQVEDDDGQVINVVVGQSTLPQTVFNSVNVLIGVGLLALPLALRYSGWIIGLIFLTWAAIVTSYTAKILAKCLDKDSSLITFADLALVSFGSKARVATSILFTLELLGACVALVVLFADSLSALIPAVGNTEWKVICGFVLIPLSFAPLRLLSFTSVLGILSCTMIVLCVFADGLIKPSSPGSLRSPMPTYLFPENWATIPISLGLLMSPWGGHGVFPNIYRDMRHPYKYRRAVDITYLITSVLDFFMAIIGLFMFGETVRDEITSNILLTQGYPPWLNVVICICVAIIPLTKIPLNARPIISTVEVLCGLDPFAVAPAISRLGLGRAAVRIVCTVVFVGLAIVVPSFDRIMSLCGSVACFSICIILPLAFHLKLYGKEIGRGEKAMNWALIVLSTVLGIVSTVFNLLPKERLGIA